MSNLTEHEAEQSAITAAWTARADEAERAALVARIEANAKALRDSLPEHLRDMTQARWDSLSRAERHRLMDRSHLHPLLSTYIGQKVRVFPKREDGASTFRVGITTGWRPVLLAVRGNSRGSSDVIRADEVFTRIDVVRE